MFSFNLFSGEIKMNSADVIMYPMPIPDSNQSIPDFYSGRSIFITGATGFVGKVSFQWKIKWILN